MTEFAEKYIDQDSLKYYRDLKNSLDTAWEEGRKEGREEGREKGREETQIQIVMKSIKSGFDNKTISELTGLPESRIDELREK